MRRLIVRLWRSKAFCVLSVLSMALAIAVTTSVFAVVDALLHPRFPIPAQDQLYRMSFAAPPSVVARDRARRVEVEHETARLVINDPVFDGMAREKLVAFGWVLEANGSSTDAEAVKAVGTDYFAIIGIHAQRGRLFANSDADRSESPTMVVGHRLWRTLCPGGQFEPFSVRVSGASYSVIGVLPDGVDATLGADVFVVAGDSAPGYGVARAHAGVTRRAVGVELARLNARMAGKLGTDIKESGFTLKPMIREAAPVSRFYVALVALAFGVAVVITANLMNLQLARGASRNRELAVRCALGASRADIVGLLTRESALLAVAAGVIGSASGIWAAKVVGAAIPISLMSLGYLGAQLSWKVLGIALAVTLIVGIVFGVLPAITLSRVNLEGLIKSGAGTGTARHARRRYGILLVAEIGVCLGMVVGATLLADSTLSLHHLSFGYDTHRLIGASVVIRNRNGEDAAQAIVAALDAKPGVAAAALMQPVQLDSGVITIDDAAGGQVEVRLFGPIRSVTPRLFRTLGVTMVRGIDFSPNDEVRTGSIIVDSAAARRFWPARNPIGRMVKLGDRRSSKPWLRVIGIAPHLLWEVESTGDDFDEPQIYAVLGSTGVSAPSALVLARVRGDLPQAVAETRAALSPFVKFQRVGPWDEVSGLRLLTESHDALALIFSGFATLSIWLAMVGLYGVVASSAARRMREVAVRIALGQASRGMMFMLIGEQRATIGLGIAVGLVCVRWELNVVDNLLFAMPAGREIAIIVGSTCAMVVACAGTVAVPAIHAARVNPVEALRSG